MLDLSHADREALIRLVLEQRETLARQEALLAEQQRELAAARACAVRKPHPAVCRRYAASR